ncbi:MAG: hypothetical protein HYV24_12880 [Deltaproteobacteria bacterium]|nr:hypothetical protein [Deltaproteobacteria bacterium]
MPEGEPRDPLDISVLPGSVVRRETPFFKEGLVSLPAFAHDYRLKLNEAVSALGAPAVSSLFDIIKSESLARGFTYQRTGGVIEAIHLMLVPSVFTNEQTAYLSRAADALHRGMEYISRAWGKDDRLQKILPFEEEEGAWIRSVRKDPGSPDPLWYRLDAHLDMDAPGWRERISIFEINACAVGGIHYGPTAERLFLEVIVPFLKERLGVLPRVARGPDARDLLHMLAARHARAIGRPTLNFIFSEDTIAEEGITEGPYIVEYLKSIGVNALIADPRELYIKRDGVWYRDTPVDIVYRNFEAREIIEMEREGDDTKGIRLAFERNQVISSLTGDFDHKAMWEVLASGEFDAYFNPTDAAIFKKHLPWTRVVAERKTLGPDGREADLVRLLRSARESLVLKPDRLCGGYGVAIGKNMAPSEWDRTIDEALRGDWVVQEYSLPETAKFPVLENGVLSFEDHNIVYGLSATPDGTGVLGRVSREGVVNVAQQGGLMPVLRLVDDGLKAKGPAVGAGARA